MKKLIATIALSVTLAGCGTSLTYDNGDINWKAVAITGGTFVAGILLCNEFCEVDHDVQVVGGNLGVEVSGDITLPSQEEIDNFVDYINQLENSANELQ